MRNRNWKVFLREICVVQTGKRHELAYSDLKTETSISHRRAPQFFFGNGKNIFRILISVTRKTSVLIHSFHAAENGKGKERA